MKNFKGQLRKLSSNKTFGENINILYYSMSMLAMIGFALDTIRFFNRFETIAIIVNIATVFSILICLLLKIKKVISIENSFKYIVYVLTFSLLIVYYIDARRGGLIGHLLLRNLTAFPLLILSLTFISGKKQMLSISIISTALLFIIILISGQQEIIEATIFAIISIAVTVLAIYLFASALEKSFDFNLKIQNEMVEQNNQLEQLIAEKDTLFAIVGHDLRGPVGTIKNSLELMLEKSTEPADIEKYGEIAYTNSGKLFELLNTLLNWANNEKGGIEFFPQIQSVSNCISQSISLFNEAARIKNIVLQFENDEDFSAYFDFNMTSTILRNLISNAIKFTPEGGRIEINVSQNNSDIQISISDTGRGIEEKDIQNIINSGKLIISDKSSVNKGTGLGLKLSSDFVKKQGGKIWMDKNTPSGTIFSFTLPRNEK